MDFSKNKHAYEIVKSKFFENIENIDQLIKKINKGYNFNNRGVEGTKGDIFEIFCEAYLKTNPEYQIKNVYPQGYVPAHIRKKLKLSFQDRGYDGVYETNDGEFCTYQSKFRSSNDQLIWQGKNGLSSFIGVSEKAHIRHLIATSNKVTNEFLSKSRIQLTLLSDLRKLNKNDFDRISNFLNKKKEKIKKHKPEAYQKIAINKATKELENNDRATIIMACGTGKTEVGLWIYEKFKPKTCLVLVPSIALVKQIRAAWLSQIDYKVRTFQLCSSKDVTKQEDHIQVKKNDLDMEFYSDVNNLKKWVKRKKNIPQIIFSTYQSSKLLKGIFNNKSPIDFAVFDEAHRTAILNSKIDSYFSYALHNKNIPIKKRLFMTATRRVSSRSKFKKTGDSYLNIDMDNVSLYGKICYNLSFYEAAKKYKAIAKPRIIISEVFSDEVSSERRKLSSTHYKGIKLKSDYLALIIAIKKAIKKYNIKKVFSFHKTVKDAKTFADPSIPESIKSHLKDFYTSYVSGTMNMRKRDEIMDEFVLQKKGFISNARCLVEGVNVPAVDMISFTHQKESEVDIVQAIGRALRNRNQNKKFGYVLVPLFVEKQKNENLEKALERTNFKKVVILIKALREHDTEIAQMIDEVLINEGRGKGFSLRNRKIISDLIETVSPEIKKKILIKSIHSKVIENLQLKWDLMIGKLLNFKKIYNHCDVSRNDTNFLDLRDWISTVRKAYRDNKLYNFQIIQLEKIGFNFKEPGTSIYSLGDYLTVKMIAKKFDISIKIVRRALKNVKPHQMYFGSGTHKPTPAYKNITENFIKKKLNVTTLKLPENLYTVSNLHETIFEKGYGYEIVKKLCDDGKIRFKETSLSTASHKGKAPTKLYEKLNKKEFTKISGVTIFNPSKYVNKTKFLKNIFGKDKHADYFDYCEKKRKIKPVGIAPIPGAGIGKVYKQLTKKEFLKLSNVISLGSDKKIITMSKLAKKMKLDRSPIKKMIKYNIIKPAGKIYSSSGISYGFLDLSSKRNYFIKKYIDLMKKKKINIRLKYLKSKIN